MRVHINYILVLVLLIAQSCSENPRQNLAENQISGADESAHSSNSGVKEPNGFLAEYIPPGYSILDSISGDLNLDDKRDLLLILKKIDEDSLSEQGEIVERPL